MATPKITDVIAARLAETLRMLDDRDLTEVAALLLDHGVGNTRIQKLKEITWAFEDYCKPYEGPTVHELEHLIDDHPIWTRTVGLADTQHEYNLRDALMAIAISDGSSRVMLARHVTSVVSKWETTDDVITFSLSMSDALGHDRVQQIALWFMTMMPQLPYPESPKDVVLN